MVSNAGVLRRDPLHANNSHAGGTTTSADGSFTITPAQFGGTYIVDFANPNYVTRETNVRVPGPDTDVSLIPATFDLAAFDQFARTGSYIHRWTTAPTLRIETRTHRGRRRARRAY